MKAILGLETSVVSQETAIENLVPVLESQRQAVAASEAKLKKMIDEYQKARFKLFKARLKQQGTGWCTVGGHFTPVSGLRFLFLTGKRWHKSHESDYLRDYSELHRSCSTCRKKKIDMSGFSDGSAAQFAYLAKKNGKGILYRKHGEWLFLPAGVERKEMPKHVLSKELAKEHGLPEEINYTCCPFAIIIES